MAFLHAAVKVMNEETTWIFYGMESSLETLKLLFYIQE